MSSTVPRLPPPGLITFAEFLESIPPDTEREISDLAKLDAYGSYHLYVPDLQLHCESETCDGVRTFTCPHGEIPLPQSEFTRHFLIYICRNCRNAAKTIAVAVVRKAQKTGTAAKYGESPPFGSPVPARVITLVGPDREMFLAGRRSENRGLGIGAFAYYRRVVENQKGRIIIEIAKVAKTVGASQKDLMLFEEAARETQFSAAVDKITAAIPAGLRIEGQNPLTLLHQALSDGIHGRSDEECLECAKEIRLVLTELAERMSQLLKSNAELRGAVSKLLERVAGRASKSAPIAENSERPSDAADAAPASPK